MSSVPLPCAQAADGTVDLVMGGQGTVAWAISSALPGDSGTMSLELRNAGTVPADLMIWISNKVETDLRGDGAALSDYLRFQVAAPGLRTTLAQPSSIEDFPDHPTGDNQLLIGPLAAGEMVTVDWYWEFEETGFPQNDAQGDGLTFNINFMLVDVPPAGDSYRFVLVEVFGQQTVVGTDEHGVSLESVIASDVTGRNILNLPLGTRLTTANGQIPGRICLSRSNGSLVSNGPSGAEVVSAYELRGYLENGSVVEVSLSPSPVIALALDPDSLPPGSAPLGLYQREGADWVRLPPLSDTTVTWEVRTTIGRTGDLAVFAASGDTTVARLSVQDMEVRMEVSELWWPIVLFSVRGGSITVSLNILNEGGMAGSYTLDLILDGNQVATEKVALEPGESRNMIFRVTSLRDGVHEVSVAGETRSFQTGTSVEWTTFIVLVVAIVGVILLATRKKGPSKHIPEMVMADYKRRVVRELGEMNLSFHELASMTNIEEVHLQKVLEQLMEEGEVVRTRERGNELWTLVKRPDPSSSIYFD